ncbi:MAG: toll/interleukin-1 receptor domain-containing protein [Phycisphaerales bacterium]|nr:toll/interleukin-1 receptor domain-containing protein [Phycisphaerales bacterium]
MAAPRRNYRVFLSHAATDSWVARQLRRSMIEQGAAVFLDEASIAIGADFEQKIRQSLRRSNELVVLLTPWALERHYVWVEIGAAWGMGMPIIAVLHGVTPRQLSELPNTPVLLKRRNLIELNEIDRYLVQLKRRVQDAVG